MNKKTFLISLVALVLPGIAAAQSISTMAVAIKDNVLIVGFAMVIIMWVVTGILFLIAMGEGGKLTTARNALIASIIGTIIIILANIATTFVANSFGL